MATDTVTTPADARPAALPRFSRTSLTASGSSPRPERLSKTAIPPTLATWSGFSRNPPKPTWTPQSKPPGAPSPSGAWSRRRAAPKLCSVPPKCWLERKEEYSRDMTREMGKVLKETRGDTQEAIDTAYYIAGEGRRLFGPTTPSELPNKFAMAVRQPRRRLRHDHPLEFSDGDSVLEAAARDRLRQHLRDQARAGHAAFHLQPGAHAGRRGRAQRRHQHRHADSAPTSADR